MEIKGVGTEIYPGYDFATKVIQNIHQQIHNNRLLFTVLGGNFIRNCMSLPIHTRVNVWRSKGCNVILHTEIKTYIIMTFFNVLFFLESPSTAFRDYNTLPHCLAVNSKMQRCSGFWAFSSKYLHWLVKENTADKIRPEWFRIWHPSFLNFTTSRNSGCVMHWKGRISQSYIKS